MRSSLSFVIALLTGALVTGCGGDASEVAGAHAARGGASFAASTAAAGADLQISGSASTGSPFVDSAFTYTLQIKNAGPDSVLHATIVDTLPPDVVFTGVSFPEVVPSNTTLPPPPPNCNQTLTATSTSVACDFGTLRKGEGATLFLDVTAPPTAEAFADTARVTSDRSDPAPANNIVIMSSRSQAAKPAKPAKPVSVLATAFTTLPAVVSGQYVFAGGPNGVGFQFTPTVSGTWSELFVSMHGDGGGRAQFSLYTDDPVDPGHPGTLLATIFGPIPPTAGSITLISVPKASAVSLVAGQPYWLFGFGAVGELSGIWDLAADASLLGRCATGPFGISLQAAPCRLPAFQIDVLH
jgi:uncharacterized repeat protein (TIGR01451 family)